MTKQEFDLKYSGEKLAVHCDTLEKAKAFLELAKSFGYKWSSGKDHTNWEAYKNETCYSIEYEIMYYGSFGFYEEENIKIEPFELEKENNMKFKVGQKVRVKTGLKNDNYYGGIFFNKMMESARGNVFTIGSDSDIEENMYTLSDFVRPDYYWSAEMLEKVEETFKIGDVVYDLYGYKAKIVDTSFVINYENSSLRFVKRKNEITKEKPLKKITKEQLAEMGYEVE